jgi:16S rRNA (guanine966-N2)-methyltransferase
MKADQRYNQLRIIAGSWRGRKLCFTSAPGLRPTPNRVRETLFNWLQPVIRGARCLDLYAGSGALGLEAASRGAAAVVLVDRDPQVVHTLREQLQLLSADQVQAVQADVGSWLSGAPATFDIVFLDPPFREGLLPAAIRQLEAGGWLAPEAWIYMEAEPGLVPDLPDNWELYRSKRAGQVGFHLARRRAAGAATQSSE